ncbi:MAG: hypothetical protein WKG01_11570 [Kofleriaceae bacterium]
MRILLVLVCLTGCSLYFDSPSDDGPPPDAGPAPDIGDPPWGDRMARCEDGALRAVSTGASESEQPGHGSGERIGRCEGACRSAAIVCSDRSCSNASDLCTARAYAGSCPLEGSTCSGTETVDYPSATTCGYAVAGQTCTCGSDGRLYCVSRTPAPSTQQKLVGKWRGIVTPPDFAAPYPVSLWIYPDGTYWAESETAYTPAFYYGGDGPHPMRRLELLSTSATEGSWADIAIYFGGPGTNTGAISALTVTQSRLYFTFYASWFGCGQPFAFDLTRE